MKGWAWRPWLWWVFACGVGGVAGGASYVEPYLGLALFGGILGVAQWLVLRRYLSRVALWAVFSVVGWILGYIAQFAVSGSLSGMGEAIFAWTGSEIASFLVFGPMTWAVFGIFQLPLLLRFRRALLWVPASILGGEAFVVAQNVPLLLVGEGTPGVLGGSSGMVIATTAGTILYGAITGLVLVRLIPQQVVTPPPREDVTTGRPAEPRRRFGAVVALVGLLALVCVFLVGAFLYSRAAGCSAEERAVFEEFPQYDGREMEPESNTGLGSCAAYYETPDPPEQVQAYFAERLVANGWEVKARPEEFGEDEFGSTIITATRGGYYYDVSYESLEMYKRPRPGVHLAVHVREV